MKYMHVATIEFFGHVYLYFEDEINESGFIIDRNNLNDFKNISHRETFLDFLEMKLESEYHRLYNLAPYQVLDAFDRGYYLEVYFEFYIKGYVDLDYLIQFIEDNDIEYCPILYRILCNEKKVEEE